jgi:hypothetical protein
MGGRPNDKGLASMRFCSVAFILLAIIGLASSADAASPRAPQHVTSTDLRVVHTAHYRIHTDLDRNLADDLAKRMDAMYDEYARRLSVFDTSHQGQKFDVYLFAKRKNYLDFTGNQMSNAAGVTIPDINVVAADLESQGRDSLRQTLQHEAFHQFATSVIRDDLPPWLNEGLAVMFQEGIWTGRNFLLGQVPPWRVRQLLNDLNTNRTIDFRKMLGMTLGEWNATLDKSRIAGGTQYTQAWAMCHFLVYAVENHQYKYRARFLDLLQRIHAGTDPMEAFKLAFSPNVEGFQTKFIAWARTLAATREAALIERQNILAVMLSKLSQDGKRFDGIDAFRATLVKGGYQMTVTTNEVKWVTDPDPVVYFKDLDGKMYGSSEQYFDLRSGAPLPDLVCDPIGQIHLRTRFYDAPGDVIEHETLVEGGGNGR